MVGDQRKETAKTEDEEAQIQEADEEDEEFKEKAR